ncbi:putative late blight resistance protein-like protein R1A-4 [Senna tora]|uniref:Putative late blight resistance protein-like protein R1A-4 n=1 Tax=Senna tora TaxID=362788 RepID=A0A834W749_9FABA|nr:putative late blight resistance protein-like protein R1A-4 [Senna tora]
MGMGWSVAGGVVSGLGGGGSRIGEFENGGGGSQLFRQRGKEVDMGLGERGEEEELQRSREEMGVSVWGWKRVKEWRKWARVVAGGVAMEALGRLEMWCGYGVEIMSIDTGKIFKVNGHRLKPFYEGFKNATVEEVDLVESHLKLGSSQSPA